MHTATSVAHTHAPPSNSAKFMATAKELEATFLQEMLTHSGLSEAPESFGGGLGEEQFSSFLRSEHARLLVEKGGVGLAEAIFNLLTRREGSDSAE